MSTHNEWINKLWYIHTIEYYSAIKMNITASIWMNLKITMLSKKARPGTSLVVQWLRLHTPNSGGPGSIPGQGTRSRMPQLRAHMLQRRPGAAK